MRRGRRAQTLRPRKGAVPRGRRRAPALRGRGRAGSQSDRGRPQSRTPADGPCSIPGLAAEKSGGCCPRCRARRLSLIHISEPTRLGMISYAVFCLKKKNNYKKIFNKIKHHIKKEKSQKIK